MFILIIDNSFSFVFIAEINTNTLVTAASNDDETPITERVSNDDDRPTHDVRIDTNTAVDDDVENCDAESYLESLMKDDVVPEFGYSNYSLNNMDQILNRKFCSYSI